MESCFIPFPADLGAVVIDGGVDLIVPFAQQGRQRALFPVIAAESGEIIVGIHVDEHVAADILKTACFDDRFGESRRFQRSSKFQNRVFDFILRDTGILFKNRFAELVDQIFTVSVKGRVEHGMISLF